MEKIKLERTKKGYPAIWEEGGGRTNTGWSTIIAGPAGEKLRPIYIRRWGDLANDRHALFPVKVGMVVVYANHHRKDFVIGLYRINKIFEEDDTLYAEAERFSHYSEGEWDPPLPPEFEAAVSAAIRKATCYHCRAPHYAEEWEPPIPK